MAGYDNGSGWSMIIDSLNNFQKQTDPYGTMDLGKTLANLFRRRKQPLGEQGPGPGEQKFVLADPNNPDLGGYLTAQESTPNDIPTAPEGQMVGPGGTQTYDPRSEYSPDNPHLKWLGNPNSKIARRMTPELQAALNQFEAGKKEMNLGQQLSELKIKSAQRQFDEEGQDKITLDEATINQLPEQYRLIYRPGMTVSRGEMLKLITSVQTKPGQVVIDEEMFNAIPEQYQEFYPLGSTVNANALARLIPKTKTPGSNNTATVAKTWPKAAAMSAQQLSLFIRDKISKGATEKDLQPYIKQYNSLGTEEGKTVEWTYGQWKEQAAKRPVNGKPQTDKQKKVVKTGTYYNGRKVIQYSDGSVSYAD